MPVSVRDYIDIIETGTIFIADDIDTDSTRDSVKTQLSQACRLGRIERVLYGVYYKPCFDQELKEWIPFNKTDVAYAIARLNGWHIIPDGNMCLNLLGLSTQVPARYEFLSDGPYKTYEVDGRTISFRHRSPKNCPKDDFTAMVIQAVKAQTRENCDEVFIRKLSQVITEDRRPTVINNIQHASSWIKDVVMEALG